MTNDLLIFEKERTMGQTISFAFLIFRKNIKNFCKGMAAAVMPWILGAVILVMPFIIAQSQGNSPNLDAFALLMILAIILFMFGYLVLNTYVNEYIIAVKNDLIDQKPHYKLIVKATYKAVPKNLVNFFFNTIVVYLISNILFFVVYLFALLIMAGVLAQSAIITGIGFILTNMSYAATTCYLFACTGPIIFISQYEKVHFFKALAINFSYLHARKGFWAGIMISFFGFILMIAIALNITEPISIIFGVIEYNSGGLTNLKDNKILTYIGLVYLLLFACLPISSFIMMFIFGANYFSQKERAVGAGLNERIKEIGNTKDYDSSKLEEIF